MTVIIILIIIIIIVVVVVVTIIIIISILDFFCFCNHISVLYRYQRACFKKFKKKKKKSLTEVLKAFKNSVQYHRFLFFKKRGGGRGGRVCQLAGRLHSLSGSNCYL